MNREQLIEKIVQIELDCFLQTNHGQQKAKCQEQPETFVLSRMSKWFLFDERILLSYYQDLKDYLTKNLNIITIKYAYMMFYEETVEFSLLNYDLPTISEEKEGKINNLVRQVIKWDAEAEKHPGYIKERPRYNIPNQNITSLETYLYGEYATYSEQTLNLLAKQF